MTTLPATNTPKDYKIAEDYRLSVVIRRQTETLYIRNTPSGEVSFPNRFSP